MNCDFYSSLGFPWIFHCCALLLHVYDEAVNDFLGFYNPVVRNIREAIPGLPIPAFEYDMWLIGLITLVIILFLLSPFAFRNSYWIRIFSIILGILMVINGGIHILGSVYLGMILPGLYSSPVLILAAGILLWRASKPVDQKNK